ncbi:hypothetical protein VOI32_05750 [Paraburkholderia caribensis]|uniref:Uncharacterized protein n=1 Tax=Paraburkholderia caribensis TaxID=75105 RepID=A0ABV0DQP6_9BURK|nr:hypothetical protein [Paraburkholderia caribensis]MCO4876556.1 hypothetical protein [Paraburkholderia caribensis]
MNKTIRMLDVLFSQALCCTLCVDWSWRLSRDLAAGLIFTSTERGPTLLVGVAVALLLRSAFGRWGFFRWVARVTLAMAVMHILIPFDWLAALAVFLATFAVLLDVVVLMGQGQSEWVARCGSTGSGENNWGGAYPQLDRNLGVLKHTRRAFVKVGEEEAPRGVGSRDLGISSPPATVELLVEDATVNRANSLGSIECDPVELEVIASYVRVQLRMMAGETFAISRYVMQYAVSAMQGMSASELDAALQRVVYAATLRQRREGGATITVEDVRAALRGIAHESA